MVDIKHDNLLGKIWTDDTSPILFIKLQDTDWEFSQYHDLYKIYLKELKALSATHKDVFVSFDLSELHGIDEENQIRNCGQFLRYIVMDLDTAKIKCFAITRSQNKFLQLIMDDILRTETALKIERFDSFYKAITHLTTLTLTK